MASAAISLLSGLGGLLGKLGGSGAKTDRNATLQGYGGLENILYQGRSRAWPGIDYGMGVEKQALGDLGASGNYYRSLLIGSRPATLGAVAPAVTAANAQEDAAKRQLATTGTARGGGVNATTQQMDTAKQSAIDQAIAGEKGKAAAGGAAVASAESDVGSRILQNATQLLGISENAATNLTSIASHNRPISNEINQQAQTQGGQAAGSIFTTLLGLLA